MKIEITTEERSGLDKLAQTKEWEILKQVADKHLHLWAYNLLKGNEFEANAAVEELKGRRGFFKGWDILVRLVEPIDEKKV